MKTVFIEATNGPRNWGKFMVGRMDRFEERRTSAVMGGGEPYRLLRQIGWNPDAIFVFDLQTREGAAFVPGGLAAADLDRHSIWVCPLFEPFLTWLYTQDLDTLDRLPRHIDLPDAEFALQGHRRPGPTAAAEQMIDRLRALTEDEDRLHPVGCATWREEAQYVIDWAIEQLQGPRR